MALYFTGFHSREDVVAYLIQFAAHKGLVEDLEEWARNRAGSDSRDDGEGGGATEVS